MEALGIIFGILLIGIFGWMLIDRRWIDDWFGVKSYPEEPITFQSVIRIWPKKKPVLFDQHKD